MPPQRDTGTQSNGNASNLGGPALAAGAFAAGAAATLVAKRLIDGRRKDDGAGEKLAGGVTGGADESKNDLATVLRRAALDVAVVASGHAADRLRAQGEESETEDEQEGDAAHDAEAEDKQPA